MPLEHHEGFSLIARPTGGKGKPKVRAQTAWTAGTDVRDSKASLPNWQEDRLALRMSGGLGCVLSNISWFLVIIWTFKNIKTTTYHFHEIPFALPISSWILHLSHHYIQSPLLVRACLWTVKLLMICYSILQKQVPVTSTKSPMPYVCCCGGVHFHYFDSGLPAVLGGYVPSQESTYNVLYFTWVQIPDLTDKFCEVSGGSNFCVKRFENASPYRFVLVSGDAPWRPSTGTVSVVSSSAVSFPPRYPFVQIVRIRGLVPLVLSLPAPGAGFSWEESCHTTPHFPLIGIVGFRARRFEFWIILLPLEDSQERIQ